MDYRDPNDDNQNAKQRILNAAEEVFAEKGFDGARVNDISNRAGVNKALLYYYFSGKQDLFEELVKGHIEDIIKSRYGMLLEKPQLKEKAMSISSTFDMFKDKKEVLRMTLMEMMKSKSNDHFLFKLFDYMFNDIKSVWAQIDYKPTDEKKLWLSVFFFVMLPLSAYAIFEDKMVNFYELDKKETEDYFNGMMQNVYRTLFETVGDGSSVKG